MRIPAPRLHKRARIEIIPLIDIIFFLLATFVMLSLSMVKDRGIAVNLPSAATSDAQEAPDEYTAITITADGMLYFNRDKIAFDDLGARLFALKEQSGEPRVVINGDQGTDLGAAVTIMDQVRKAGIGRVAIRTKGQEAKIR